MKIAIQGELASFSHEAAEAMLPRASVVPCARSLEVFDRVKRRTVDGAVIPIENSLAGSVAEHFDLLLSRDVQIVREFRLRIIHNLIAMPGTKLGEIRRVFSHPVALDQCRDLFAKNPKLEPVPFYDTAGSVKHVVGEGLRDAAGIASRRAAEVYKGKILKAGIEDDKKNFTRFFRQSGRAVTSLQRGEHSGSFVQGTQRVHAARHQLEQDRFAAHARPSVGIRVFCRSAARRR
jgi:prephenate dehydratase